MINVYSLLESYLEAAVSRVGLAQVNVNDKDGYVTDLVLNAVVVNKQM